MCNIAGYTGNRRAAPILIEMLKREQYFDGGVCTGIATIHEGKLYHAKVVGNVDELLKQTDAINFPGTVGIAHSRPGGTLASQAHPFVDADEKLALVLNGTLRGAGVPEFFEHSRDIMQAFLDRGIPIRSAIDRNGKHLTLSNGLSYHDTEPYALMAGDNYKKGMPLDKALGEAIDELPADIVTLAIHVNEPGTIAVGRITRPMSIGVGDGETFLATTAIAFPENVKLRAVTYAPPATVCKATPGAFEITPHALKNVAVEDITPDKYHKAYTRLESLLIGMKDNPLSLYHFYSYTAWRDIWSRPFVECKYVKEGDLLKPTADLTYRILYSFYKEGRLRGVLKEKDGMNLIHMWLENE